jgi:hypothetical protein
MYEQQWIKFGNAFKNRQTILQNLFKPNHKESEEMVEKSSAKWIHLAYTWYFSQTNAIFE